MKHRKRPEIKFLSHMKQQKLDSEDQEEESQQRVFKIEWGKVF